MKAQWQAEKQAIQGVREKKARLEEARGEAERAERAADLQRAAELRYGEIPELEKDLAALEGGSEGRVPEATPGEALQRGRATATGRSPDGTEADVQRQEAPAGAPRRRPPGAGVPEGGGRRGRRRRGGGPLDGHPGEPPAGGRGGEADPHGGAPARTG